VTAADTSKASWAARSLCDPTADRFDSRCRPEPWRRFAGRFPASNSLSANAFSRAWHRSSRCGS